jgi:hypothetical protein
LLIPLAQQCCLGLARGVSFPFLPAPFLQRRSEMNWQTKEILEKAKASIADETVFSTDQISKLRDMIDLISKALDKEASMSVSGYAYALNR